MPYPRLRHSSAVLVPSAPALLAASLAALPKCPFCLLALAALIGVDAMPLVAWLPTIFPVLIVAAGGSLAITARGPRVAPASVGVLAAAVMLAAWFFNLSAWWLRGAAVLLVAASLWQSVRCGLSRAGMCHPTRALRSGR